MGDLGFWALAQEDPDYLALVTPEGDEVSSGELLGRANQVVHALRAQGLGVGDVVATLLPNCAEMLEVYLAALQAGWYLVPINHHLVAPEVAYILKDSGAKVFVAHERFAEVAIAAADEAGVDASGRLAVGDVAGFGSYAEVRDAQPTTLPDGPHHRRRHELHVGDDREPQGHLPLAHGRDARAGCAGAVGAALPLRDPAAGRQRPHHRFAALPHRRAALRERVAAFGSHDRADGQVVARGNAPAHRGATGHDLPHGAHPVPPAAGAPRRRAEQVRRVLAAAHDPRRRARARSTSSTR